MTPPTSPRARRLAGWLCLAMAFALVMALGLGLVDPFGMSTAAGPASLGALLVGLLPSLLLAVVVFAIGLWLLKGAHKP